MDQPRVPATLARRGRATGKVRWPLRPASVKARPAASRPLIRAHTQMGGEPLMTPESTGEARTVLAAFPGLSSPAADQQGQRYPLSFTQEWFIGLDQGDDGGTFGRRFILVCPVRITGHVDLAVLQAALDDVVARHELLRTVVVRDADPPYQQVYPPCQVPLEIRDLPPVTGKSRDMVIQELGYQTDTINAREVPLLRARLCKFDDQDSVLFVTVHHSVSDAWSLEVIMRDLGAFYVARATGTPAELPPVRQYREYAEWQRASATSSAEDGAPAYWRDKLSGAREFTISNDHGHPDSYSRPYSLHRHGIEADVIAKSSALATASRGTVFTVMLSAFYVLAHEITGATDLTIRAFTAGRGIEEFQNTMGLFLNCVPFRTDIADCTSFRDIVARTKETLIDAIAHELPVNVIEQTFPDFIKSRADLRTSQFIISCHESQQGDDLIFPIAEGACQIEVRLDEDGPRDIPSGMVWNLDLPPSGNLSGSVLFNRDEFDESTVAGWAADLRRILASAVRNPDQDWKTL
jgi:condensation enzyme